MIQAHVISADTITHPQMLSYCGKILPMTIAIIVMIIMIETNNSFMIIIPMPLGFI